MSKVKKLTKPLADCREERHKIVPTKYVAGNAITERSATEYKVQGWPREAESTATGLDQALQARNADMNELKDLVGRDEDKVESAENDSDGAKSCLNQM